ncbi:hypothetical protein EYW49_04150 [Siculibacillus lacustris]|uniref:Uncharacterized protein n=1 Tax=Siculibacillus lacustris TaxID=1549641 RepID=A0A4Q9VYS9_9HYPH|nr:hypothetical protein [Siculibacillus lacustris]TBW40383.1 hypothetical protein EYW49_04150 [Siculibacillus lacustris]
MKTQGKLVSGVSMAIVVGLSAYAFAAEPQRPTVVAQLLPPIAVVDDADAICPPQACTIVFKTERGGPPSARIDVR